MKKYNDIIQSHIESDILKCYDTIKNNPDPFIWCIMNKENIYFDEVYERVQQGLNEVHVDSTLDII
jgi:site-specific DNA-adenine methylase